MSKKMNQSNPLELVMKIVNKVSEATMYDAVQKGHGPVTELADVNTAGEGLIPDHEVGVLLTFSSRPLTVYPDHKAINPRAAVIRFDNEGDYLILELFGSQTCRSRRW